MSFNLGDIGEQMWIKELSKTHTDIVTAPKEKFYDWDVKGTYNGRELTYEVKYDNKGYYYAHKYNREVNLYIEFKNTTLGEDSGIRASKADYYVYILKSVIASQILVFNRRELLNHLEESNYKVRGNSLGGDDNALGWTPKLSDVKHLIKKEFIS